MYMAYHMALVKTACEPWLSPAAIDLVIGANFNCDVIGNIAWKIVEKRVHPFVGVGKKLYKPEVHLDGTNSFDELVVMWRNRVDLLNRYFNGVPPNVIPVIRNIGHATHAAADVYTHTNYIELLYEHYRAAGISDARLAAHIAENAPLFSELVEDGLDAHPDFKPMMAEIFSDQSLPDEGPRSHKEINKDTPKSPRCNDPRYPDIFAATFGLAQRETNRLVNRFFERLRAEHADAFEKLKAYGADREFKQPGRSARRAKRLTDLVGTWD